MVKIGCPTFRGMPSSRYYCDRNRLFTWLSVIALTAYSLPGTVSAAGQVDGSVETARNDFVECQMASIDSIDDGLRSARAVALDLTNHCIDEYKSMIKVYARDRLDNSNERRMFTIDRNADFQKIDASLPLVNLNRNGELPR